MTVMNIFMEQLNQMVWNHTEKAGVAPWFGKIKFPFQKKCISKLIVDKSLETLI